MIKNIVFDCSDTLLHFTAKDVLAERLGDKERAYNIHFTVYRSPAWRLYDLGEISFDEMKARALPLLDEADRAVADKYLETRMDHYEVIEGIPELLMSLKGNGYKLFVISNYPDYFDCLWNRFDIFRLFDGRCVSSEEHASKGGDGRLFDIFLEKYRLDAGECIFTDDHDFLVHNAEAHGMKGIVFTDTASVTEQLRKVGVKI